MATEPERVGASNEPAVTHLLRPAAGCKTFEELQQRLESRPLSVEGQERWFISTRRVPRRLQPPAPGASVFWIIDRMIQARAAIAEVRELPEGEGGGCLVLLVPSLHRVRLQPHPPFQGWRYLPASGAPGDVRGMVGVGGLPVGLRRELCRLGLV